MNRELCEINPHPGFRIMKKFFQIPGSKKINFNQIKPILRNIRLIFSQRLPQIEAFARFLITGRNYPSTPGELPIFWNPFLN
jgi:hypothetical protein